MLCLTLQLLCPYHINLKLFLIIQREEKRNFITRITIKSVPDVICLSFLNMWVSHACQQAGCYRELQHTNPQLNTRGEFVQIWHLASQSPRGTVGVSGGDWETQKRALSHAAIGVNHRGHSRGAQRNSACVHLTEVRADKPAHTLSRKSRGHVNTQTQTHPRTKVIFRLIIFLR